MEFDRSRYLKMKTKVNDRLRDRRRAFLEIREHKEQIVTLTQTLADEQEAHEIFKQVSTHVMVSLQERISEMVTLGLQAVFPDPPEFVANMVLRRDKLECDLLFKKGDDLYKPIDSSGGGLLDVTSFALRLAYWSLNKSAPVFILDEPFKYVSPDLQPKIEQMLRMFSEELQVQIIMVSHSDYVMPQKEGDRIFVISKKGKFSKVEV